MNPFDYVKSINDTKINLMVDTENDELAENGYNPFLTNRALSYFNDTLAFANEMNLRSHTDNKLQYEFLLNIVRKRKRFSKWIKQESNSDVEVVKEYYGYSNAKAEQALSILTNNQLEIIKNKLAKGGKI